MSRVPILIAVLVAAGFVLLNAVYTVDEREKAMVLQFGQVRAIKEQPGLAFKIPFIQNVVYYDSRIQGLDTSALEVTPLDDRRLIVDAFARWRIDDVSQFRVLFKLEELIEDADLFAPLKELRQRTMEGIDFPYHVREALPPARGKGKQKFARR